MEPTSAIAVLILNFGFQRSNSISEDTQWSSTVVIHPANASSPPSEANPKSKIQNPKFLPLKYPSSVYRGTFS
jgi:hypothetical protein